MNARQIAFLARSRAVVVIPVLTAAVLLAGCSGATPTGQVQASIYAELYGHVTAPAGRTHISIQGRAYSDSADALAYSSTGGYLSAFSFLDTSSTGNYVQPIQTAAPEVVWLDLLAAGQTTSGVVFSTDTAWAVRVRLDSIGGTLGHDSIAVNFTLP